MKDAPIYGKQSNESITNFIDTYLTCDTENFDLDIATLHKHHHTKQCKRSKNKHCRRNFPFPPMRATTILEPLLEEDKSISSTTNKIQCKIELAMYDTSFTFDNFLNEIDMTEENYILALRSTIHRPIIFLQRKPS